MDTTNTLCNWSGPRRRGFNAGRSGTLTGRGGRGRRRAGRVHLDRVGVDVLEELEATVAVRRLEHGDLGMVTVEADGSVGPLSPDRVTAENGQPEVGEEGD